MRTGPSLRTRLRVTWFGHSSMLLEIDGFRVLIGSGVGPACEPRAVQFGPKRFFEPTLCVGTRCLPVDVVLISHDHYDHLGKATVRALAGLESFRSARWVTSLKVGAILRRFGVAAQRITELNWTESVTVHGAGSAQTIRITAWPARHFSGRSLFNRFQTLWSSFVLEGEKHRVYFGADSGWWDGFSQIGERYEKFDLTMLEIGASHPLWETIHLGPDNAVKAYHALGGRAKAGLLMPIHWALFNLALHAWREPMERLEAIAAENDVPLWCPEPGVPTDVTGALIARGWRTKGK